MARSRRTKTLNAAERLFAAQGYRRTTVKGIAAEASVPLKFVRGEFRSKRAIYEAVIDRALAPPIATLTRAADNPKAVRPEVVLAGAFEFWSMHPAAAILLYRALLSEGPAGISVAKWNRKLVWEIQRYAKGRGDQVQAASQLLMGFNAVVGFYAIGESLLQSASLDPDRQELRRRYRAMLLATSDQFAVGLPRHRARPNRSQREADVGTSQNGVEPQTVRSKKLGRPPRTGANLRVVSADGGPS